MKKKQPARRFLFYIILGFLLSGSLILMIENEAPQTFSPDSIADELIRIEPAASALNITEPLIEASTIQANYNEEEEIWKNPLSIFSDMALMEAPEKLAKQELVSEEIAMSATDFLIRQEQALKGDGAFITIIIDDMGVDQARSRQVTELDGKLTLAFLPYGESLDRQVRYAEEHNHSLIIHMPMEAMNGVMDNTPGLLKNMSSEQVFLDQLDDNLDKVPLFTGLNNHMGSKLTQDEPKMTLLMKKLRSEGLFFIDSRTIHSSVAADVAARERVPYLVRDVFLDHKTDLHSVMEALRHTERIARQKGHAIAIGHPKENTIKALKLWLPTLEERGYQLISADDLIEKVYPGFSVKQHSNSQLLAKHHQGHTSDQLVPD